MQQETRNVIETIMKLELTNEELDIPIEQLKAEALQKYLELELCRCLALINVVNKL